MAHLPPCVDLNAGAGIGNRNPAGHPAGRLPLGLNVHGQPLPCYHVLAPFMHIEFFNSRRMWALLKGLIVQSFAGLAFAHLHAYTAALDSVDLVEQADVSLFFSAGPEVGGRHAGGPWGLMGANWGLSGDRTCVPRGERGGSSQRIQVLVYPNNAALQPQPAFASLTRSPCGPG
jgi:hypothetical protein